MKPQHEQYGVERKSDREANPYAGGPQVGVKGQKITARKADQPEARRGEQQWDARIIETAQRAGADHPERDVPSPRAAGWLKTVAAPRGTVARMAVKGLDFRLAAPGPRSRRCRGLVGVESCSAVGRQ